MGGLELSGRARFIWRVCPYDHFANELISFNLGHFGKIVMKHLEEVKEA
ncbi:MAG: hypothetical protein J5I98_35905 [Phaeodactylibacter sp.]|nr:hypothetical protein [Phaeodactylibacter sp.]